MAVKPIPDGYTTLTPYLIVSGGEKALEYYKQAFGAVELFRVPAPGGKIGHAEMQMGSSRIMLADEFPEMGFQAPAPAANPSVAYMLYVEQVDDVFAKAIAAGGTILKPLTNHFYGDRSGTLKDPFGHAWTVATHIEDVTPEEIDRRLKSACNNPQA